MLEKSTIFKSSKSHVKKIQGKRVSKEESKTFKPLREDD